MSVTRFLRPRVLCGLWLLCYTLPAAAQATSGSIEGFVTDPTGGRVADARIVAREESSGLEKTTHRVLRDWAIAGIFTARSGLPVNVVRNAGNTNLTGLRPDVVRSPGLPAAQRTLTRYFDTAAFDIKPFTKSAALNPGNAGRACRTWISLSRAAFTVGSWHRSNFAPTCSIWPTRRISPTPTEP